MKLFTIDPKSALSKTIRASVEPNCEQKPLLTNKEELFNELKEGDVCIVLKSSGEEFILKEGARKAEFEERLQKLVVAAGIPPHVQGFRFLKDAVKLAYDDPFLIDKITKGLYPKVAKLNLTTPSKVERAIRNAIDISTKRGRIDCLNRELNLNVFGKGDKPTNGELIALIADRLIIEFGA